jgi:hypothetical protein
MLQCKNCVYWEKDAFTQWVGLCVHPHKPDTGVMKTDAVYSCGMASREMEEWSSNESQEEVGTGVGALLL